MPTLDWDDETAYADKGNVTFAGGDQPADEVTTPKNSSDIRFTKLTGNDGRRHLDIAVLVGGHSAHYVLGRDDIERLKAFLGN